MFEGVRGIAVDLEPRQRLLKRTTMHQGATCAWGDVHIGQSALKAENLTEPFDVPARERKNPQ